MRSVSIEEARRTLGDLVDRARLAGEPTMVTRHGKAGAVVVNAEWFAEAEELFAAHGPATAPEGGDRP